MERILEVEAVELVGEKCLSRVRVWKKQEKNRKKGIGGVE